MLTAEDAKSKHQIIFTRSHIDKSRKHWKSNEKLFCGFCTEIKMIKQSEWSWLLILGMPNIFHYNSDFIFHWKQNSTIFTRQKIEDISFSCGTQTKNLKTDQLRKKIIWILFNNNNGCSAKCKTNRSKAASGIKQHDLNANWFFKSFKSHEYALCIPKKKRIGFSSYIVGSFAEWPFI